MAIAANRQTKVSWSGDATFQYDTTVANSSAPGDIDIFTLAAGDNTITLPTGGSTVKAATIVPPAGNANVLKIKGAGGDTGITISKVDPMTISFDTVPPASFIINAAAIVTGLRVIWS